MHITVEDKSKVKPTEHTWASQALLVGPCYSPVTRAGVAILYLHHPHLKPQCVVAFSVLPAPWMLTPFSKATASHVSHVQQRTKGQTAVLRAQEGPVRVPTELAAFVARRSLGLVSLPQGIEAALEEELKANFTVRTLRRRARSLIEDLRTRSRSVGRGGIHQSFSLGRQDLSTEDQVIAQPM